jgi:hypothetical protein
MAMMKGRADFQERFVGDFLFDCHLFLVRPIETLVFRYIPAQQETNKSEQDQTTCTNAALHRLGRLESV